jgi:hypothetical protein
MLRDLEERETEAITAAREAVGHVITAYTTHPDVYAPKACILTRNPQPESLPYLMFKLEWDDAALGDFRLDDDASVIVRDVAELRSDEDLAAAVLPWLEPHDAGQVEFRALPGIFQEAFVRYWTGRDDIPFPQTSLWWAPSYGAPDSDAPSWVVRVFPATGGEGKPAPGELGYLVVPREVIISWFDERGW